MGYCEAVQAQIKNASQMPFCTRLVLVCIEGGAITQLEASVMPELTQDAVKDLGGTGCRRC